MKHRGKGDIMIYVRTSVVEHS